MTPVAGAVLTAVAGSALVAAHQLERPTAVRTLKPLASAGFLLAAAAAFPVRAPYGYLIAGGLASSFVGDVLLLRRDKRVFLGGMGAFALAHLAYIAAFASRGLDLLDTAVALTVVAVIAFGVWRWLSPHVEGRMRVPVLAYVAVVSAMFAFAMGMRTTSSPPLALWGALLFWLSDIAVARDRFVAPGPRNKLWGLPLYYVGQILLALSIAA